MSDCESTLLLYCYVVNSSHSDTYLDLLVCSFHLHVMISLYSILDVFCPFNFLSEKAAKIS